MKSILQVASEPANFMIKLMKLSYCIKLKSKINYLYLLSIEIDNQIRMGRFYVENVGMNNVLKRDNRFLKFPLHNDTILS